MDVSAKIARIGRREVENCEESICARIIACNVQCRYAQCHTLFLHLLLLERPPVGYPCHRARELSDVICMPMQKQTEAEEHQQQHQQQNGRAALPENFDYEADRHRGQLALRKLYHESDRLLVVLYTSPTCGPCRTLKPIFSKVVDDYPGKVGLQSSCIANPSIACWEGLHMYVCKGCKYDSRRIEREVSSCLVMEPPWAHLVCRAAL